ncbi:MAG: AMP-binding protein [Cyclobacteriaceae bacterium]
MAWIKLNDLQFSLEEIQKFDLSKAKTEFEKSTIQFCKAWLDGQNEFSIQTSGSTGAPKKIVLSRQQMEASARQTIRALHLKSDYTSLVCLDTKYVAGQMMLVRSLILGMNVIAVDPSSNPLEKIDSSTKIDFAAFVPFQLDSILDNSINELNKQKSAIIGGATINNSLKEKAQKATCDIFATYGMTETISHIALQKINGENPQDYFETLDGVNIRLDSRGCLCIRTDYLRNEIVTNDLVELFDSTKFMWLGRIDNVINSGGVKIVCEKVEAVFEKIFESVQINQRFFITGIPDEKLGQRAVIVVEGKSIDSQIRDSIILEASKSLSKYELPKEFYFVKKIEETENGKIKRVETLKNLY